MNTTRRGVLVGFTIGGATLVAPRASVPQAKDECAALAGALADAMAARHGGKWRHTVDHEAKFVLIVPDP